MGCEANRPLQSIGNRVGARDVEEKNTTWVSGLALIRKIPSKAGELSSGEFLVLLLTDHRSSKHFCLEKASDQSNCYHVAMMP